MPSFPKVLFGALKRSLTTCIRPLLRLNAALRAIGARPWFSSARLRVLMRETFNDILKPPRLNCKHASSSVGVFGVLAMACSLSQTEESDSNPKRQFREQIYSLLKNCDQQRRTKSKTMDPDELLASLKIGSRLNSASSPVSTASPPLQTASLSCPSRTSSLSISSSPSSSLQSFSSSTSPVTSSNLTVDSTPASTDSTLSPSSLLHRTAPLDSFSALLEIATSGFSRPYSSQPSTDQTPGPPSNTDCNSSTTNSIPTYNYCHRESDKENMPSANRHSASVETLTTARKSSSVFPSFHTNSYQNNLKLEKNDSMDYRTLPASVKEYFDSKLDKDQHLILRKDDIQKDQWRALGIYLAQTDVKGLRLLGVRICKEDALELCATVQLQTTNRLEHVSLCENSFGSSEDVFPIVVEFLLSCILLDSLAIWRNSLSDAHIASLQHLVKSSRSLSNLSLTWNLIRDDGALEILSALRNHPSPLKSLDLSYNLISAKGCELLRRVRQTSHASLGLNLFRNPMFNPNLLPTKVPLAVRS
eukprot:TRINITY_DN6128_c0_g1_i1.p1 TRINITY_DN6128_c0_g1~~TRINITY_DN6128_c0_g1_i1.p1  ORF type:complete len:532 (+),score=78.15 TRINITY_DN6128_c0_g1_i1:121-1716(+)